MNLRGFWNKRHARAPWTIKGELRAKPVVTAPEGTWHDHPDREATARAEVALCTLPKVARHDS